MSKPKKVNNKSILISFVLAAIVLGIISYQFFIDKKSSDVFPSSQTEIDTALLMATPLPTYTIAPEQEVSMNVEFPTLNTIIGPEIDLLFKLKPGAMTKEEVESIIGSKLEANEDGDYVKGYEAISDQKPSTALVYFYFNDKKVLSKVHYYNAYFGDTNQEELEAIMGIPNMIYRNSPSEYNTREYVYSSKGVTFLFDLRGKLEAFTMYPPKTFKQYVDQYEDMMPYDVSL